MRTPARPTRPRASGSPAPTLASWPVTRLTALFDAGADIAATLARLGEDAGPSTAAAHDRGGPRNGLGAQDAGPIRPDPGQRAPVDRAVMVRARRRRMRSTCASIPASRSVPAAMRRRACACAGSTRTLRRGASVLDYGCGSGILAIAAMKLGAGDVCGVDIDPQAVRRESGQCSRECGERLVRLAGRVAAPAPSMSSSPTFSPIRWNCSRRCLRDACARTATSCSPASSMRRRRSVAAAYARWFNTRRLGQGGRMGCIGGQPET